MSDRTISRAILLVNRIIRPLLCVLGIVFLSAFSFGGESGTLHFSLGSNLGLSSEVKDVITRMGYEMGYGRNGLPKTENPFELDINAEYSVCKNFLIGMTYAHQIKNNIEGHRFYVDILSIASGAYLTGIPSWHAFYFTGSFAPAPGILIKNTAPKITAGVGLSSILLKFESLFPIDGVNYEDEIEQTRLVFSAYLSAEYHFYITKQLSVGLRVGYKYVPLKIENLQIDGFFKDYDQQMNLVVTTYQLDFPNQTLNLGGFGIGITVGYHPAKKNK